MHKLCLPLLTLALGLPLPAHARDDKTPSLPEAGAVKAAIVTSASASAAIAISDKDALSDDILAVIDLPLAAADAREAGVAEAELSEALTITRDGGLSAGDASEVLAEEADATRKRGVKKGFGRWVRMQVAAGLRGKKLADKIRERKQDIAELDPTRLEELRLKLEQQRDLNKQWRQGAQRRRGELLAKGKARVLLHKERHEKLSARIDAAQTGIDGAQDDIAARLRAIDERIAAAADADKPALAAEKARLEKALGKLDKAEDRLDKREDDLDKREDRREDRADKREDKREDRADKREDHADKREDRADKREDHADAKHGDKHKPPTKGGDPGKHGGAGPQ